MREIPDTHWMFSDVCSLYSNVAESELLPPSWKRKERGGSNFSESETVNIVCDFSFSKEA